MSRVIAVAICGLMLAGCGSILSGSSLGDKGSEPVILKLESKPPGAEAKLSNGASCVTPCELPVAPGNDISVSFSLARHQPQSIAVHAVAAKQNFIGVESTPASFDPNPVHAELQPAAPPRKPRPKRPAIAVKPQPAQPGAPAAAPPKRDRPAPPAASPVQAGQASGTAPAPSAAPPASPWPAPAPWPASR
ncbi:MAG: hypothetical protein R3D52_07215 [Xanthobacteraceae bacterium]